MGGVRSLLAFWIGGAGSSSVLVVSELIADICDAVVAEIEAGIVSNLWPDGDVSWEYLYELQRTANTLRYCVTPPPQRQQALLSRRKQQILVTLAITVSQRVEVTDNTTLDPLVAAIEALATYYGENRVLTGMSGVEVWGEVDVQAVYDPTELYDESAFKGTMTVVFAKFAIPT